MTVDEALALLDPETLDAEHGEHQDVVDAGRALAAEVRRLRGDLQTQKHNMTAGLMAAAEFAAENEAKLKADLAAERSLAREVMAERDAARAEAARLREECNVLRPGAENYNRERLRAEKAESSPAPTCKTCRHRIDQSRAGFPDWCVVLETNCDRAGFRCGAWAALEGDHDH